MAMYELKTMATVYTVCNGVAYENNLVSQSGPTKIVDAKSLKHLQELYFAFVAELIGNGKDCYHVYVVKARNEKARVFPGFKKASMRGGCLVTVVNKDAAVKKAWEQHEACKQRQADMGIAATW